MNTTLSKHKNKTRRGPSDTSHSSSRSNLKPALGFFIVTAAVIFSTQTKHENIHLKQNLTDVTKQNIELEMQRDGMIVRNDILEAQLSFFVEEDEIFGARNTKAQPAKKDTLSLATY